MRAIPILGVVALAGCGSRPASETPGPPSWGHSARLSAIMKNEVNQPFSALSFAVYFAHDGELARDAEPPYPDIAQPTAALRAGLTKVRFLPDLPASTPEAREVFVAYIDGLLHDSDALADAIADRDRPRTEALLTKISVTCNDCHHFFRLAVDDTPHP